METYLVKLSSEPSKTFRCTKAAQSCDLDLEKKLQHELSVTVDVKTPFKVGLILGASGSGKTTLAKKMFGDDCFFHVLDEEKTVLDQINSALSYDECSELLMGVGLTSVPCWVRPVKTLSNGQKARVLAAVALSSEMQTVIIDEWTSVVDRASAKIMSHCVSKFAKKTGKQIILLSCHYDVVEWIDPDWIVDCNLQKFIDRRLLRTEERKRTEQLQFEIRECTRLEWKRFSKYHYLSDDLPKGRRYFFGLYHGVNQIGFLCFANYTPVKPGTVPIFHSNRLVIHPDFCGLGVGIKFVNFCSDYLKQKYGYRIMAKFSSVSMYRARIKDNKWRLINISRLIKGAPKVGSKMERKTGFREYVKTWSFEYIGGEK